MRQVWSRTNLLFGIDGFGNPYLVDYHLLVSQEEFALENYTDYGSMNYRECEGINSLVVGNLYDGTLTIFEDEDGELFRFSNIHECRSAKNA